MIVTVLLIVMSGRFQTRRQPYTDAAETQLTPGPPTVAANILSSAFPHLAAKKHELPGAVHDGSAQQSRANSCRVLAAARQWLCDSTGSPGPDLRTGFAGIRGKTVFSLRHANDGQEKQDGEISTHEILAESEL